MSLTDTLKTLLAGMHTEGGTFYPPAPHQDPTMSTPAQRAEADAAATHYALTIPPPDKDPTRPALIRLACLTETHGPQRAAHMMTLLDLW